MGGPGSGRRYRWEKKTTIEECRVLDVNRLVRDGLLDRWPIAGLIRWFDTQTGEQTASVGYRRDHIHADIVVLHLSYTVTFADGNRQEVKLPVPMTTTKPTFGGRRWYFRCPLVVHGVPCERRVAKLYSPPGGLYFGCRRCYNLTYTSCQESHRWDRMFADLAFQTGRDPADVKRILTRLSR